MIAHWMVTSWRALKASPVFTLITIASLSIGCCGALLAGASIQQHVAFERWNPMAERIVLLRYGGTPPGSAAPAAVGDYLFTTVKEAIAARVPDIEAQTIVVHGASEAGVEMTPARGGERLARPLLTDADFFKLFPVRFLEGDAASALQQPGHIVLTESEARRRFGNASALGQTIDDPKVRAAGPVVVDGVIVDFPRNTRLSGDYIMRFSDLASDMGMPLDQFFQIEGGSHYLKLKPGVAAANFSSTGPVQIKAAISAKEMGDTRISLVPLTDVHLAPRLVTGLVSTGDMSLLLTLAAAAGALLVVSAFNYVLLSLARNVRRRPEVAIRKVLGAAHSQLVTQYMAESAVITLISLIAGFCLAELTRLAFAEAIGQPSNLFDLYDPAFLAWAFVGLICLSVLVGIYPAFHLASIRPRTALGTANSSSAISLTARWFSGGMVGLQVAAATVLTIIAFTMTAQADYVAKRPLGFDAHGSYVLRAFCPQNEGNTFDYASQQICLERFTSKVATIPGVDAVGFSTLDADFVADKTLSKIQASAASEEIGRALQVRVGANVLQMLNAKLLAGRLFDERSAADRQLLEYDRVAGSPEPDRVPGIITRAMLPMIGATSPQEALGKAFFIQVHERAKSIEVVGVVEDWHQRSLRSAVSPIIFLVGQGPRTYPVARIASGAIDKVTPLIRQAWAEQTGQPGGSLSVASVETAFSQAYASDRSLMWAVTAFAGVAIFVSALGVFGLSAFDMGRRVRETGIRKVLGASTLDVAGGILLGRLTRTVIASMVAWPFGYFIAQQWLLGYAYRTDLTFFALPLASIVVTLTVALAISINLVRTSIVRPAKALAATPG